METETVIEIKKKKQFQKIMSNNNGKLIIIDFFAHWCGPCMAISPYIDELSKQYTDVNFYKINTDNKDTKDICVACKISNIPAFYYFLNGELVDKILGSNKQNILDTIIKHNPQQD